MYDTSTPFVCEWLKNFLEDRHRHAAIQVFDTSEKSLTRLIQKKNLMKNLPSDWVSWDIYVDIAGFATDERNVYTAIEECKNIPITLAHLSQLLGYSRVVLPSYSFILSPKGIADSLKSLLLTFNRTDILSYKFNRGKIADSIIIAKWDARANCLDYGSIVSDDNLGRL